MFLVVPVAGVADACIVETLVVRPDVKSESLLYCKSDILQRVSIEFEGSRM